MSSKFEARLMNIEQCLGRLPVACPCEHDEVIADCNGCTDRIARVTGLVAVASIRRALDADERFNK